MSALLDTVCAALHTQNARHTVSKDGSQVVMPFQGKSGVWACLIGINEAQRMVLIYSQCPTRCPAAARPEMSAFLHMANSGFARGAFELDLSTGAIRFRVSIDARFHPLSTEAVLEAVGYNVGLFDHGLRGILAIIHGQRSAAEALALAEQPLEPERTP